MDADTSIAFTGADRLENGDIDETMFGADEDDEEPRHEQPIMSGEKPPPPLPPGWFLKESSSNPGYFYYFNQDTGECCWDIPTNEPSYDVISAAAEPAAPAIAAAVNQDSLAATVKSILKTSSVTPAIDPTALPSSQDDEDITHIRKKSKRDKHDKKHRRASTDSHTEHSPKEVRVLHILKKHSGSRRPSSWRVAKITISKEKAIEELRELLAILQEVGDPEELRATFEELAKTESDCSSAKRGGDLGFFGKKKMQPAFEKASFGLKVGQLSDIVDTSSGVHIILRLA
eukprot:scaffold284863_cov93-Cyclotella_meneghiniana.AAC.3